MEKSDYKYIVYVLSYFKKRWIKLCLIFLLSLIIICLSLIPVEVFRRLIDIAIPAKDINMVLWMLLIVFFVHILILIIDYIQDLVTTKLNLDITLNIQTDFFNKLLHIPSSHYSHLDEGQLMEKVIDDSDEVVDSTFDLIITPALDIGAIIITVAYMFLVSPSLTLVCLSFVPVFLFVIIPVNHIIRKKYGAVKTKYASIYSVIQEKLRGIKEIISHNKTEYETEDLTKKIREYNRLQYNYERFSTKLQDVVSIIGDIAPYTVLLFATYKIIGGSFEIGTLVAFSMLMPRLFGPVKALANKELEFQTLGVTAKRVFSILHDSKSLSEGNKELKNVKGEIEFKNVSYEYPNFKIFNKLNLKLEPNKVIAIVGESGVGKSTIFNLLIRKMEHQEGDILLDGQNIKDYKLNSLRHYIALVNQKPFLFSNTILYNISYGHSEQKASFEEVVNAAKMVNIHETILKLPQQYKTIISEEGDKLSLGQIHRIALARAMLRKPKILLLDDPTAGLDLDSVNHLVDAVELLKKGRTLIIITNDINLIKRSDQVIVLERRRENTIVSKIGTPREVINNGVFQSIISGRK